MPAYSAKFVTIPPISIAATVRAKAKSFKQAIQQGFADATRPREGFIRPSTVDIEQDIREVVNDIATFRAGIATGTVTGDGKGLEARTRKTARFESSFGGFQIF